MSAPVAERGSARPRGGGGIGRAAVLIGAITMLARVIGFGRQVVFAHTVQASCLGTAYTTANMVPNIIYDIVAGGALTAVVVPVLAGPARAAAAGGEDGDAGREQVRQTSAALLSWAVLLLVPVSLVVAVIARPLVSVLLGGTPGCPRASMVTLAARMLVVFAPQILLYGLAVVLYGILQAHRRFAAPALAPVLSSLVVIGAYFWFGVAGRGYQDLTRPVPALAWIVLAAGTTAGVAALVVTPLWPALRLRLRLRPSLRFPAGVGARVRALATAGIATLIAQDASVAVVIVLANSRGGSGSLVLYSFAWAVFFVPYAVLAVPIATSAFPELSARAASPDASGFDATSATSTRAVTVASWLGRGRDGGHLRPARAGVPVSRQPGGRRPAAGDRAGCVRAGARRLRADRQPVPGALRGRQEPGLGAGGQRRLAAGDRRRPADRSVRAALGGGALAGRGHHHRPDRLGDRPAGPGPPVPRPGPAARLRAGHPGRAGRCAGRGGGRARRLGRLLRPGFLPNVGVTLVASAAVLAAFLAVVAVADGGDLRAVLRKVIRA